LPQYGTKQGRLPRLGYVEYDEGNSMKHLYPKAVISGSLISVVPAVVVGLIVELFPSLRPDNLQIISDIFSAEKYGPLQYFMLFTIIVVSPVIEEVIFRGALWGLLKKAFDEKTVFIVVSVVFAVTHLEPVHVIGLLPISFLLGWFRYQTGSIKASILCHMSNNLVACLVTIF